MSPISFWVMSTFFAKVLIICVFVLASFSLFSHLEKGDDIYFHAPIRVKQHLNSNLIIAGGLFVYVANTVNQIWSNHTNTVLMNRLMLVYSLIFNIEEYLGFVFKGLRSFIKQTFAGMNLSNVRICLFCLLSL